MNENDIRVRNAILCYNVDLQAWMIPGGGIIKTKTTAQIFCEKMADALDLMENEIIFGKEPKLKNPAGLLSRGKHD